MDYKLGALKVLCSHLKKEARLTTAAPPATSLFGVLFQRAWLQGVLVSGSDEGSFVVDDGSDAIELSLSNEPNPHHWTKGMYVMVVGLYVPAAAANGRALIKVHKMVDLSAFPDREAMWYLEVVEAYKLFYLPSVDE